MNSPLYVAEPPARYRLNQPLVVDCSVLAAALFNEPQGREADAMLLERDLHAPNLIEIEFVNAALKKSRAGFAEVALQGLANYEAMELQLHRIDRTAVHELALRLRISAFDASYVWLAAELKYPFATFDEHLATVARQVLSGLN